MKILSQFESKGNIELLSQTTLAVFASKNATQEIYKPAQELFLSLSELTISLCGGWQAPLEKYLLNLASSEMKANIVYYSAKDLGQINPNAKLDSLDTDKKLLLISAQSKTNRASKNDVDKRDDLLFKQVDKVLFMYIEPGGRLEKYYNQLVEKDFPVFVLDHGLNRSFIGQGCVALNNENVNVLMGI